MASRSHVGRMVVDRQRHGDPSTRRRGTSSRESSRSRQSSIKSMPLTPRPTSSLSSTSTLIESTSPLYKDRSDTFVKPFDRQYRRRLSNSSASINNLINRSSRRSRLSGSFGTRISVTQKPKSFVYRDGRRYLHDTNYVLPYDLQEIQRQNLSTVLTTTVLGGPLRVPIDPLNPPKAILEVGCADGYWSHLCHDFFIHLGLPPPAFTGIDIARQGTDLRQFGIDWTFVNHDLSIRPLPFPDESFDLIMSKEMTIAISFEVWWLLLPELLRILRPGGYLEFRDRDYKFRTMRAPPRIPIETSMEDAMTARETACYQIMPESEFVECENRFLKDVSDWTHELMESNGQHSTPMRALEGIESWPGWDTFEVRRIAIPLCPLTTWEHAMLSSPKGEPIPLQLDAEQQALRSIALEVVIEFIQSLEAPLRRLCGKNEEEWRRWWNFMVTDLIDEEGAASGECLEIGVAWGRKAIKPKT